MFAELISLLVGVTNNVKPSFWNDLSHSGSDYFPQLPCLCAEPGRVMCSENIGHVI